MTANITTATCYKDFHLTRNLSRSVLHESANLIPIHYNAVPSGVRKTNDFRAAKMYAPQCKPRMCKFLQKTGN